MSLINNEKQDSSYEITTGNYGQQHEKKEDRAVAMSPFLFYRYSVPSSQFYCYVFRNLRIGFIYVQKCFLITINYYCSAQFHTYVNRYKHFLCFRMQMKNVLCHQECVGLAT